MSCIKIIRKSYTSLSYTLVFEVLGNLQTFTGKNSGFFNKYAEFDYTSKEEFVIFLHNKEEWRLPENIRKAYNIHKRAEHFKAKKFRIEVRTLADELKEEHPTLTFSERYDLACDILSERKNTIVWKYLKESSDAKISSVRHQKLNKNILKKLPLMNKNFKTLKEFYTEFRLTFDWSSLGLSTDEWSYCSVLKGNFSIVGTGNRLVSYNKTSRQGLIFDSYDMLNILFKLSLDEILEATNVTVEEYNNFNLEKEHYNNVLSTISDLESNPVLRKFNVFDVYQEIVKFGISKMNTLNFKNDKAVFYYSIKHILDSMGIEKTNANIAKVCNKINILTSLGLLSKVMNDDVPKNLFRKSEHGYNYNYFTIPNFEISEVENNACVLNENKINLHNISFKTITLAFSTSFAKLVFNKLKTISESYKKISNKLFNAFKDYATSINGIVNKFILKNCIERFDTLEDFELNHNTLDEDNHDDIPF